VLRLADVVGVSLEGENAGRGLSQTEADKAKDTCTGPENGLDDAAFGPAVVDSGGINNAVVHAAVSPDR
jgi:hypothetical protein